MARRSRAGTPLSSRPNSTLACAVRQGKSANSWNTIAVARPAGAQRALEVDRAGVRPEQPGQQVEERRLAAARRPHDRHQLLGLHGERDAGQRLHAPRARVPVALARRCRRGFSPGRRTRADGSAGSCRWRSWADRPRSRSGAGVLKPPRARGRTRAARWPSAGEACRSALSTTYAHGTVRPRPSASPITPASSTAGCATRCASTSAGDTHLPPTFSMSSLRPSK